MNFIIGLLAICAATVSFAAEDTIYLDDTVISGNQELPKVLYILPWKSMSSELLAERPLEHQHSNYLTPIFPDSHRRELGYREAIQQFSKEQQQ